MMKLLVLTSHLLARITLTLISSFAIAGCFQTVNFHGFSLVILKLVVLKSYIKNRLFYVYIVVFH